MAENSRKSLSELELNLLRNLASSEGMTVREVAEGFGEQNGYARTTILTVMERLRTKGYVTRKKKASVFVYSSALTQSDLMRNVVGGFVSKALGGSVSPLVAYLAEDGDLSDEEIARLRQLVESLEDDNA